MREVSGLAIGEGAIANILARAQTPLVAAAATIAAAVRASPVVGSEETSALVRGKTRWQWVMLSSTAICHVIADTRAASVVTAFLQGAQPGIGVADRCAGQLGHGALRQMCLAHLLRDANYAAEAGDTVLAPGQPSARRLFHAMRRDRADCSASSRAGMSPTPTTPASARCGQRDCHRAAAHATRSTATRRTIAPAVN